MHVSKNDPTSSFERGFENQSLITKVYRELKKICKIIFEKRWDNCLLRQIKTCALSFRVGFKRLNIVKLWNV